MEKEETVVALNARLDGLPITAVLNVKSVTPVDLVVVMVNVRHVQKVFTKTPKVKQNVRGVKLEKHTPMPKPNVVGVI